MGNHLHGLHLHRLCSPRSYFPVAKIEEARAPSPYHYGFLNPHIWLCAVGSAAPRPPSWYPTPLPEPT